MHGHVHYVQHCATIVYQCCNLISAGGRLLLHVPIEAPAPAPKSEKKVKKFNPGRVVEGKVTAVHPLHLDIQIGTCKHPPRFIRKVLRSYSSLQKGGCSCRSECGLCSLHLACWLVGSLYMLDVLYLLTFC